MLRDLLPLVFADLRRPTCPLVTATDACTSGWGVVEVTMSLDKVRAAASLDERWRYQRVPPSGWQWRDRALDAFSDPRSAAAQHADIEGGEYLTVEFDELHEPWFQHEARSMVCAARRLARNVSTHNSRLLLLGNNMGVVLAACKGRCSCFPLLRALQMLAALHLFCPRRVAWLKNKCRC